MESVDNFIYFTCSARGSFLACVVLNDAIQEELTDYYMAYPNSHNETTDEPIWGQYARYGDDKYIVAYLEAINEEIPNLLMMAE